MSSGVNRNHGEPVGNPDTKPIEAPNPNDPASRRHPARRDGPAAPLRLERTNDFVIQFANVNGSGSASANRLFARSILRMGVPDRLAQHLSLEHPGPADLVRGAGLRGGAPAAGAAASTSWSR